MIVATTPTALNTEFRPCVHDREHPGDDCGGDWLALVEHGCDRVSPTRFRNKNGVDRFTPRNEKREGAATDWTSRVAAKASSMRGGRLQSKWKFPGISFQRTVDPCRA